jgi:hypothetical protein
MQVFKIACDVLIALLLILPILLLTLLLRVSLYSLLVTVPLSFWLAGLFPVLRNHVTQTGSHGSGS